MGLTVHRTKLVVLICEEALEALVAPDLLAAGAKGYTVCEARGRGTRGVQDGRWLLTSNVRIEVLCHDDVAQRIMEMVFSKYSDNYGLVIYTLDVETSRSHKF